MIEKIIYYSFEAWTTRNKNEFEHSDRVDLFSKSLEDLIEKIKLFNRVACFECWTSLSFFKWNFILSENEILDSEILDACYFPQMIGAHKIKVWGKTYEI